MVEGRGGPPSLTLGRVEDLEFVFGNGRHRKLTEPSTISNAMVGNGAEEILIVLPDRFASRFRRAGDVALHERVEGDSRRLVRRVRTHGVGRGGNGRW
jgi:hypothetical protein